MFLLFLKKIEILNFRSQVYALILHYHAYVEVMEKRRYEIEIHLSEKKSNVLVLMNIRKSLMILCCYCFGF